MFKTAIALSALLTLCACNATTTAPDKQAESDQPAALVPPTSASQLTASELDRVLAGDWRSSENRARDVYRHPSQTLQFFGVQPYMTVVEIAPGAGWYSEVLAPLLMDNGHYIAAVQVSTKGADAIKAKFAADPAHYGKASVVTFDPSAPAFGPAGSADRVLTFRNVHNWVKANTAAAMFRGFFAVLKPGGVLGVVDHRAAEGATLAKVMDSGYLPVDSVIKLATDAGFRLEAQSEINANPRDTKDYPKGVWTLPPTYQLGDQDHAKYQAIGESDRMTLRFVKPAATP
ncbi:putative methyltransferase [Luteibacter sp. Sphag1AF]|uniref:class I SAM-dependent methyltransferase n=1 Tax=Luteibacter sp. Sphag1AF TaxID=2587031 RepID=UPI00161023A8|nr:class I SAM-dependent methyltransferase [Luteibacter sp. Sphag1AF]MBB3227913.1 putative methyltransferase [Luteibacter sp. Sphag1AF]